MRHRKKGRKLGRTSPHRKKTLMALSTALIENKRIVTTISKAKELRPYVEPVITRAKEDTDHNRRQAFRYLQDKKAVTELFDEVAEKVDGRPGGYTRLIRLGRRSGDGAEMAMVELVDYNDVPPQTGDSSGGGRTRRGSGGGSRSIKGAKREEGAEEGAAETEASDVGAADVDASDAEASGGDAEATDAEATDADAADAETVEPPASETEEAPEAEEPSARSAEEVMEDVEEELAGEDAGEAEGTGEAEDEETGEEEDDEDRDA